MKANAKGDERKSVAAKTFSWLAVGLLQICGQVNNYPRAVPRLQRQFAAKRADALAHSLNAEAGKLSIAYACAVILHFQAQPFSLLSQENGDLAGFGVFTDFIE